MLEELAPLSSSTDVAYSWAYASAESALRAPDTGDWWFLVPLIGLFLGMALIAWRRHDFQPCERGIRQFFLFVFPPAVYRHPSARLDLKLFLAGHLVGPVVDELRPIVQKHTIEGLVMGEA